MLRSLASALVSTISAMLPVSSEGPAVSSDDFKVEATVTSVSPENAAPETKVVVEPPDVLAVGRHVLCDVGYGPVKSVQDGIVEIALPWGRSMVQRASVHTGINLHVHTFYKRGKTDESGAPLCPSNVDIAWDLDRPLFELLDQLAQTYKVDASSLHLVSGATVYDLDGGSSTMKSSTAAHSRNATAKGKKKAAPMQAQRTDVRDPSRKFDLCAPSARLKTSAQRNDSTPTFRLLMIVDEKQQLGFSYIGDENGLFYWLGTRCGTAPWENPCNIGSVRVYMSTSGGDPDYCLFDRNMDSGAVENSYSDDRLPWVGVALRQWRVRPRHIVICQEGDHLLRNWALQGSNDVRPDFSSDSWTTLLHVSENDALMAQPHRAAFSVPDQAQYFQNLRICLHGPSHKGKPNYDITQLEVYGYVQQMDDSEMQRVQQQQQRNPFQPQFGSVQPVKPGPFGSFR